MSASDLSARPHNAPGTLPTLGWALRRAMLGIVIMTVTVAAAACLLYFTIDPETEARAEGDTARKAIASPLRLVR